MISRKASLPIASDTISFSRWTREKEMKPPNILTKTKAAWNAGGLSGLRQGWSNMRRGFREERAYGRWMANHELTGARRKEIENQIASLKTKMLVSVVL